MFKKLLFLSYVLCASFVCKAKTVVDYDKPYDEIKEQLSSFDSRHSLMPVEAKSEPTPKVLDNVEFDNSGDFGGGSGTNIGNAGREDLGAGNSVSSTGRVDNVKHKSGKANNVAPSVAAENTKRTTDDFGGSRVQLQGDGVEDNPIILKRPRRLSDDEDFRTIVVNGESGYSGETNAPVVGEVLKPNMRLDDTSGALVTDRSMTERSIGNGAGKVVMVANGAMSVGPVVPNGMNNSVEKMGGVVAASVSGNAGSEGVVKIKSPVINERADSVVSKPLFDGKDKAWVQAAIREARTNATAKGASFTPIPTSVAVVPAPSFNSGAVANTGREWQQIANQVKTPNVAEVKMPQVEVANKWTERPNVARVPETAMMSELSMLHVASYKDEKTANNGVKVLRAKYPLAQELPAVVQYEDTGKGWYYRLYFTGEKNAIQNLCSEMKKRGDWCKI